VIVDFLRLAFLGGILSVDRAAGWNLMLSQPLVGACLAGALVHPGAEWELWALRLPIAVGALLQLLLTNPALPASQRPFDTATAGPIGGAIAVLGMAHLHTNVPASAGGLLWVLLGVGSGLLASVVGGWIQRLNGQASRLDAKRSEAFALAGNIGAFERVHIGALARLFTVGALWTWCGTLAFLTASLALLPMVTDLVTARRVGFVFAVLLGASLAAAYETHARGVRRGWRWSAAGAAATAALLISLGREGA
jgi:hypothetical protein